MHRAIREEAWLRELMSYIRKERESERKRVDEVIEDHKLDDPDFLPVYLEYIDALEQKEPSVMPDVSEFVFQPLSLTKGSPPSVYGTDLIGQENVFASSRILTALRRLLRYYTTNKFPYRYNTFEAFEDAQVEVIKNILSAQNSGVSDNEIPTGIDYLELSDTPHMSCANLLFGEYLQRKDWNDMVHAANDIHRRLEDDMPVEERRLLLDKLARIGEFPQVTATRHARVVFAWSRRRYITTPFVAVAKATGHPAGVEDAD